MDPAIRQHVAALRYCIATGEPLGAEWTDRLDAIGDTCRSLDAPAGRKQALAVAVRSLRAVANGDRDAGRPHPHVALLVRWLGDPSEPITKPGPVVDLSGPAKDVIEAIDELPDGTDWGALIVAEESGKDRTTVIRALENRAAPELEDVEPSADEQETDEQ